MSWHLQGRRHWPEENGRESRRLVVHGPSGVGKSRLLAGLVAEWLHRQPASTIAHLDAAGFAEACLEAARSNDEGGWSELRARYRTVGLLVLDDLEGLERVSLARDELIHTLDALDALGASIAVSCHVSTEPVAAHGMADPTGQPPDRRARGPDRSTGPDFPAAVHPRASSSQGPGTLGRGDRITGRYRRWIPDPGRVADAPGLANQDRAQPGRPSRPCSGRQSLHQFLDDARPAGCDCDPPRGNRAGE